jgi:hypothetical protein
MPKPKPRSLTLRDYELRRLLDVGTVDVWRVTTDPPIERDGYLRTRRITFRDEEHYKRIAPELCPFGAPGDTVAVREGWVPREDVDPGSDKAKHYLHYRADYKGDLADEWHHYGKWRSPATMPAWAVRLKPTLTAVRVARVQGVTEAEAIDAGVEQWRASWTRKQAAEAFLFASIAKAKTNNGPVANWLFYLMHDAHTRNPAHKWEANPWCFVGTFTRSDILASAAAAKLIGGGE